MQGIRLALVPSGRRSPTTRTEPGGQLDAGTDPPMTAPIIAFAELVRKHHAEWHAPDPSFATHLEEAANDPTLQSCGEDTEKAVRSLLRHGLICNLDAAHRSLGRFIVEHLLQPMTSYDLELTMDEAMTVPTQTRLLFVHLAEYLDATIFLFSNRGVPRIYRPPSGTFDSTRVCGILHTVDSILARSEYINLSFVDHGSRIARQVEASSASSQPAFSSSSSPPLHQGEYTGPPPARFRATARSIKRTRVVLTDDQDIKMKNALQVGW
jgi:hypothetical protein